ncbi:MAG: hypothetical protein J5J00_11710 [Deltaproteobacteria bacterium]|nr:hypothetical protein [Deltaproteobacteria bacterium]
MGEAESLNQESMDIRRRIDQTRESLTNKLEALEGEVKDTIGDAKESMTVAVEEMFDIEKQAREHPWPFFAVSVLIGVAYSALVLRAPGAVRAGRLKVKMSDLNDRFQQELKEVADLAIGTFFGTIRDIARELAPPEGRPPHPAAGPGPLVESEGRGPGRQGPGRVPPPPIV